MNIQNLSVQFRCLPYIERCLLLLCGRWQYVSPVMSEYYNGSICARASLNTRSLIHYPGGITVTAIELACCSRHASKCRDLIRVLTCFATASRYATSVWRAPVYPSTTQHVQQRYGRSQLPPGERISNNLWQRPFAALPT
jgi:hypothetical protein